MKHFWMTAAVGALCALAAQAWAAPQTQLLELVATHHHLRGAQAADQPTRSHKHAKGKKKSTKASRARASHEKASRTRGKGSRRRGRHAEVETTAPSRHAKHGQARHAAIVSALKSETPESARVGRHESLATIARRTGVSVSALARLNHLRKPYHVHPGARLKLPARRYYVVKSGDTLYSISRRFGVDPSDLSAFNSIGLGRPIRSGQKLYMPDEAVESAAREAPEAAPETATERPSRRSRAPSYTSPYVPYTPQPSYQAPIPSTPPEQTPSNQAAPPIEVPPAQTPGAPALQPFQLVPERPPTPPPAQPGGRSTIIQTSPPPSAAEVVAAGRGKFVWPTDGTLISVFGSKPDGQRNDGLNIAADAGQPVRAAADGQVVYAGDQVPSFGNLVLVKHDGGWVTAYAHMSKILVRNRDQVVQGQELGEVGQTGSVDRPQLHFEIRYAASPKDKATPVDPGLLLPQH